MFFFIPESLTNLTLHHTISNFNQGEIMKSLSVSIFISLALILGLAACSDKSGEEQTTAPATTQQKQSEPAIEKKMTEPKEAESANEKKADEPKSQKTTKDTETVTNEACLAAVKKETNESDVAVLKNEFSEANTLVQLGVGPNRAPWKCLVSNDGDVAEVSFMGTDGDSVEAPAQPAATSSSVSAAAIDACLNAVKAQTNEANLDVTSTEFSEANSVVMIAVGPQRAPWKCLVSNDGDVAEVSFAGEEGKL